MAGRKSWDSLSESYRGRLERGGITRADYQSGASLAKARGHGSTPEHPAAAEKHPDRYQSYIETRRSLERRVEEKKIEIWGTSAQFNRRHSSQAIQNDPVTHLPVSSAKMRAFLEDDWEDLYGDSFYEDDDWAFLYYH